MIEAGSGVQSFRSRRPHVQKTEMVQPHAIFLQIMLMTESWLSIRKIRVGINRAFKKYDALLVRSH